MTNLIEQIKANREAGTPGPWWVPHFAKDNHPCDCTYILSENGGLGGVAKIEINNGLHISEGGNDAPDLEQAKANARRIACVPDMEARILSDADRIAHLEAVKAAADELAGAVAHEREMLKLDMGTSSSVDRSLIAYCKASDNDT